MPQPEAPQEAGSGCLAEVVGDVGDDGVRAGEQPQLQAERGLTGIG